MGTMLEPLDAARIRAEVTGTFGRLLLYEPELPSTNTAVRELPPGKWQTGLVFCTDFQTAGRGRSGRGWMASSPK